jgi:hypothetical protein
MANTIIYRSYGRTRRRDANDPPYTPTPTELREWRRTVWLSRTCVLIITIGFVVLFLKATSCGQ